MIMSKLLQLTLALLKPDVTKIPYVVQSIHHKIVSEGFIIVNRKTLSLSQAQVEKFYEEHSKKFFYNRLTTFMMSGPIEALILLREDAIEHWRQLMGPTKVYKTWQSHPDSIRGTWGLTDTRNTTHGSDSPENAMKEINFFFPDFDFDKWNVDCRNKFIDGRYVFDLQDVVHRPI